MLKYKWLTSLSFNYANMVFLVRLRKKIYFPFYEHPVLLLPNLKNSLQNSKICRLFIFFYLIFYTLCTEKITIKNHFDIFEAKFAYKCLYFLVRCCVADLIENKLIKWRDKQSETLAKANAFHCKNSHNDNQSPT